VIVLPDQDETVSTVSRTAPSSRATGKPLKRFPFLSPFCHRA